MNKQISNFWLSDESQYDVLTGEALSVGKDYQKITATLRAISNFVNIVTGENIPVTYSTKDESYTDGKQVVLSSNIKDRDFDPTVGLALHEGSHIKLTDFDVLVNLVCNPYARIPKHILHTVANRLTPGCADHNGNLTVDGETAAIDYILPKIKNLLNIVEDRRIDNFIYKSAPGYRGYYQAMYDKYFNSAAIDKGLRSSEARTEDWESYMFRLCNITNPNRDLNALKGLKQIWKVLDLKNISRLKTTADALVIAFLLFEIIESYITYDEPEKGKGEGDGGEGDEGTKGKGAEGKGDSESGTAKDDPQQLTAPEKERLKKAIVKQKDFIAGDIKKTKISKKDRKMIDATKAAAATTKNVGAGVTRGWDGRVSKGTECLVVKNVTKQISDSELYSTVSLRNYNRDTTQETISEGLRLGTQLGRKLQVRNDESSLKYNRLRKGNIDKRMIASLGFGNEQVFNQIFVDRYKPIDLHISIDASGSMYGEKWREAVKLAIAIAKAGSMVQNLNVAISFRSTEYIASKLSPAIFIAYDSKKDRISKIRNMFGYIGCPGTTPEGLCFEAILDTISSASSTTESYFLNLSDGAPYFDNRDITYYGDSAVKHTKEQVNKMKANGVKVLSYFISGGGSGYGSNSSHFSIMYGKDAEFINTTKLSQLAKSLNNKFLTK
jgi:hypothetical protein